MISQWHYAHLLRDTAIKTMPERHQVSITRQFLYCWRVCLFFTVITPYASEASSRGLGSMSRYSAHIVICFIAYIFLFLFLCGFGWEIWRTAILCTVPSAIVHCNQNEAGRQTIKAPSMPSWGAAGSWDHSLVKSTDKMDEICISWKLSVQEPSEWRVFCIPVSNCTVEQATI